MMFVGAVSAVLAGFACSGGDSGIRPLAPSGETEVADGTPRKSWAGSDPAPAIPGDVTWFNVSRPLTLEELKGRIVLLDFWTTGCINCQHIIPDLKRLEEEFGEALVVIGVHSGKYATEHEDESIREAVRKYGLVHPVVNDPEFAVWNTFGANAWPTLVLIDPAGNLVGGHAGEGVYPLFQPIIASLAAEFEAKGELNPKPLPVALDAEPSAAVLSYPGKVLADEKSGMLYIADSGNNRVLVATLAGELRQAIGTGKEGFADGGPAEAAFRQPQGLALSADGKTLFVADTRNHAVRAVDTTTYTVKTIAGTGAQLDRFPVEGAQGIETALASPWDVLEVDGTLYITMAGIHQVWQLDVRLGGIGVFAGTSREGIENGDRRRMATLAQPSGITTDGETLFWVDPESSALRAAQFDENSWVSTLVGTGLFDYGDRDGRGAQAQFQHPQGVVYADGALYIADTYNHRLRVYDLTSREVGTAAGGDRGWSDGVAGMVKFDEPSGISEANGEIYIADTNNHLIRVYNPANGRVDTLTLTNLGAIAGIVPGRLTTIELPSTTVAPGATNLRVTLSSPSDHHLNGLAPSKLDLASSNPAVLNLGESSLSWSSEEPSVSFPVPVILAEGTATLTARASVYYCRTGAEALCFIGQFELVLPVEVVSGASAGEVTLKYELPPGS